MMSFFITKNREKKIQEFLENAGEFTALIFDIMRNTFKRSFSVKLFIEQLYRMAVGSLFLAALVSFFVGMVMALQISVVLDSVMMGISQYVGAIVGKSMVAEMSPMLLAIVFAGRIGSAVTAEIGTMKVSEQLDALQTLYTNQIEYVAVPRFWAGVVALPMLVITADIVGVLGGAVVTFFIMNSDPIYYLERAVDVIGLHDFIGSVIKSTVFGAETMLISCYFGFKTEGGAYGVGKYTTNSDVCSFVTILISDYMLVTLFSYFL